MNIYRLNLMFYYSFCKYWNTKYWEEDQPSWVYNGRV